MWELDDEIRQNLRLYVGMAFEFDVVLAQLDCPLVQYAGLSWAVKD